MGPIYVARHLGDPAQDNRTAVRERVSARVSQNATNTTLAPRGRHAAYSRYMPMQPRFRLAVIRSYAKAVA